MLAKLRVMRRSLGRPVRREVARVAAVVVFAGDRLLADGPYVWAVAYIPTVMSNLQNWILGLLAGLATLFLTFGGVRYLMAGGDPGEIEAAKRALKAAAIGYALAILAPVLVTVLQGIVGGDTGSSTSTGSSK